MTINNGIIKARSSLYTLCFVIETGTTVINIANKVKVIILVRLLLASLYKCPLDSNVELARTYTTKRITERGAMYNNEHQKAIEGAFSTLD